MVVLIVTVDFAANVAPAVFLHGGAGGGTTGGAATLASGLNMSVFFTDEMAKEQLVPELETVDFVDPESVPLNLKFKPDFFGPGDLLGFFRCSLCTWKRLSCKK